MTESKPRGLNLAIDPAATSPNPNEPAFIVRPTGAPVYYGFRVLDEVSVEGFTLGTITDFESNPSDYGDAFVVAPDGSRAGLVWETGQDASFSEVRPCEPERWGVWAVSFPWPMNSRENARKNLAAILPELKKRREQWKISTAAAG